MFTGDEPSLAVACEAVGVPAWLSKNCYMAIRRNPQNLVSANIGKEQMPCFPEPHWTFSNVESRRYELHSRIAREKVIQPFVSYF
jgi:hypothetical protein